MSCFLDWTPLLVLAMTPSIAHTLDADLGSQLQAVSRQRMFFGHQSVGKNILDGLDAIAREAGVPLRIAERGSLSTPGLVHTFVGENQKPLSKIEAFRREIDEGAGRGAEIAFFKFCYVDFSPDSDVEQLFQAYRSAHEDLRRRHPGVTLVHVTVPLTVTQRGVKARIKRLLGRRPAGELENVRREAFNTLIRSTYGGKEPLFDLARIESTYEDGGRSEFVLEGKRYPALVPAYTDDGEHLNAVGRRRAALGLVEFLAALPARR
jgi:hypothetical protein